MLQWDDRGAFVGNLDEHHQDLVKGLVDKANAGVDGAHAEDL